MVQREDIAMIPPTHTLESLPTELILQILLSITDLATLRHILYASPVTFRIFSSHRPASITETVLCSGYYCRQIQVMFRFYAECLESVVTAKSQPRDHDLARNAVLNQMRLDYRQSPPLDAYDPPPLREDLSMWSILDLLNDATDITILSFHCLARALRRFRSLSPRQPVQVDADAPSCFVPPLGGSSTESRASIRAPWDDRPSTEAVNIVDIGPPTWTEQQRVMRAFWRLQLVYYIQLLNSWESFKGNYDFGRLPDERYYLRDLEHTEWAGRYGPAILRPNSRFRAPRPNMSNIDRGNAVAYYTEDMHVPPEDRVLPTQASPEYSELVSIIDLIEQLFGQEAADNLAGNTEMFTELVSSGERQEGPKILPGTREERMHDKEMMMSSWLSAAHTANDELMLLEPSPAVARMFQKSLSYRLNADSLLGYLGLEFFIPSGFALWCEERLRGYGLIAPKGADVTPLLEARMDWTWLSLLSEEELALAKKAYLEQPDTATRQDS